MEDRLVESDVISLYAGNDCLEFCAIWIFPKCFSGHLWIPSEMPGLIIKRIFKDLVPGSWPADHPRGPGSYPAMMPGR